MKRLPIKAGKDLAQKYNQAQVLIVTWDAADKVMHTVSYGKTHEDCEQASQGMRLIREALGFSEKERNLLPCRVEKDYDIAEEALGMKQPYTAHSSLCANIKNHRLVNIVLWVLKKLHPEDMVA